MDWKFKKGERAMIVYAVLMFAVAAMFVVLGIKIGKGHTNLINCYREEKVKDKTLYCRKFSRVLLALAAVLFISGVIGLLGQSDVIAAVAVAVQVVGMIICSVLLFSVQKKYGGGVF